MEIQLYQPKFNSFLPVKPIIMDFIVHRSSAIEDDVGLQVPMNCQFCCVEDDDGDGTIYEGQQAVSKCTLRYEGFQGCGLAFCEKHGLPHLIEEAKVAEQFLYSQD